MKELKTILIILLILLLAVVSFFAGIFITGLDFTKSRNTFKINPREDVINPISAPENTGESNEPEEITTSANSDTLLSEDNEKSNVSNPFESLFSAHFANFGGDLTYSLHFYADDTRISSESHPQKSASIIKLFIMDYAYSLIEKGELKKDAEINGQPLSSLIESMITVSDNNSTNILINHFTMEKINAHIKASGYSDTVLQRRMLDTEAASRGEENYTSARDVMAFLDKLYENKDSFPENEMLNIMKRQTVATKLRRNMPGGISMASKTGELSDTENDVGIVFSEGGDYAIVCLTGGGNPSVARDAMAKICREIYDILQTKRS